MSSRDHDLPSWDTADGGDPEVDPGMETEAVIEHTDRPYASGYGTTAREEAEGETLDQRLREEQPEGRPADGEMTLVDGGDYPDGELVGEMAESDDPFLAPEEAAVRIRERQPGGSQE